MLNTGPGGSFFKSLQPTQPQDRKARAKAALKAWQVMRRLVLERDDYRCRSCGSKVNIDVHHMQFRSAGGASDDPKNLLAMCRVCHCDLHAYRLTITGGRRGANGRLIFGRS